MSLSTVNPTDIRKRNIGNMTTAVLSSTTPTTHGHAGHSPSVAMETDMVDEEISSGEEAAFGRDEERMMHQDGIKAEALNVALANSVKEASGPIPVGAVCETGIRSSVPVGSISGRLGVADPLAKSPSAAAAAEATSYSGKACPRRSKRRLSGEPSPTSQSPNSIALGSGSRQDSRSPVVTRNRSGTGAVKKTSVFDPSTEASKRQLGGALTKSPNNGLKRVRSPRSPRHSKQTSSKKSRQMNALVKPGVAAAATSSSRSSRIPSPSPVLTAAMGPPLVMPSHPLRANHPAAGAGVFPPVPSPALLGMATGRTRVFSMDLDPAGIDFGVPSDGLLSRKNTLEDDPVNSAGRSRGMSFELFSFGIGVDEPLPLPNPSTVDSMDGRGFMGRPRGDSIIFDPISFSDGGIHETNALIKLGTRKNSQTDSEVDIMNTPGVFDPSSVISGANPNRSTTGIVAGNGMNGKAHIPSPLVSNVQSSHRTNVSARGAPSASYLAKTTYSKSSSSIPAAFAGKTINMPHGSAAAAAAAMSLEVSTTPHQTIPSSLSGTAIAHTACPMDLLNKEGRIGIYLPEARRARIAKFHSKRKNRIWRKRIKYDCRKKLADSRPRIKGRFVKRSDMDDSE